MYNNYNRKSSTKNWLLFACIVWILWLILQWFANQGELVVMNREYLDAKFKLDSINTQHHKYTQTISELEEDLRDIQTSMKKSEDKLNRLNNLYWIEKSKNDTTIKTETNE